MKETSTRYDKYMSLEMKNWFTEYKQYVNSVSCQDHATVRKGATNKKFNFTCHSGFIRWLLSCKL